MIGTPEAQYITNKESGVGFLRVGMEDPVKFSTVYTGINYVPSAPSQDQWRGQRPRTQWPQPTADPPVHGGSRSSIRVAPATMRDPQPRSGEGTQR